jgi:hypothetical protein
MKKFIFAILGVVLLAGIAYAASELSKNSENKTYSWRYKITVEIDTPEGIKTGSSVREATVLFIPTGNTHPNAQKYNSYTSMKGEAVIIDLGERGKVFAVQNSGDYGLPFEVFEGPPGRTLEGAKFYGELKAKGELGRDHYPMFVMFKDMNDPLSVQLVYKSETRGFGKNAVHTVHDNFEDIYGPGFKLQRVLIEMTDEGLVYKIKEILPWILDYRNKLFDGRRIHTIEAENRLANGLGAGSFTIGEEK